MSTYIDRYHVIPYGVILIAKRKSTNMYTACDLVFYFASVQML